ncbi:hypothetical protein PAEPH01_1308 [Pancytospora epiphaga]|nr:hypothetical protein PAEPH01_1308 [Pancytospora epiphaga]
MSTHLNDIGVLRSENYRFSVKGLKLEPTDATNPLTQIIEPYFKARENIVVVTPPFSGKAKTLLEIFEMMLEEPRVIVTDSQENILNKWAVKTLNIDDVSKYKYIAFYNSILDLNIFKDTSAHVSIFIDYTQLADLLGTCAQFYSHTDAEWYKGATSLLGSNFMSYFGRPHTSICTTPGNQLVEFAFATSIDLIPAAVRQLERPEHTFVYTENSVTWEINGCTFIKEISKPIKCKKFIFTFIPTADEVVYVLDRVEAISFVYKMCDFPKFTALCDILSTRKISIPKHIKEIAKNSNKQIKLKEEKV